MRVCEPTKTKPNKAMKTKFLANMAALAAVFAVVPAARGGVIDFVGGTARLSGGTDVVVGLGDLYYNVDYYIQDGIKIDFVGAGGIIGNYYAIGIRPANAPPVLDNVIHAHWGDGISQILFSKVDGSTLDLNYMDLTSNTITGGGQASGSELSYVSSAFGSMRLPSSDWGLDYDYYGSVGDGVARIYLDSNFDGITSFSVTSQNAYCFGLDNFYIDEAPPPHDVPDGGSTLCLLGVARAGSEALRRMAAKR